MIRIDISEVNKNDIQDLINLIPYTSSKIKGVKLDHTYLEVDCINEFEYGEKIFSDIKNLLNIFKNNSLTNDRNLEIKLLEDFSHNHCGCNENIFNSLVENKCIRELSPGVFAYSGIYLKIMRYFQRKITEFSINEFRNIHEESYPSLFPVNEYIKGGYFENFPHYIMLQTKFKNDIRVYDEFENKGKIEIDDIEVPHNVLRHAACAPLYPSLENKILDSSKILTYLVSGTCYRNEETNIKELSRLNEFNMMEYVFIGDDENVKDCISRAEKLIHFWINKFNLDAKVETANDSFFANNYKKLKFFQLIGNSKVEYKVYIPHSNEYISCCSTNYHRTHFTKPYNIKNDKNEYCYSACHAFGIERLAFALLSQKGLISENWDKETKDELSKYIEF